MQGSASLQQIVRRIKFKIKIIHIKNLNHFEHFSQESVEATGKGAFYVPPSKHHCNSS